MPRGNFVLGLPAGPAGGVSRRGPAAGLPSHRQRHTNDDKKSKLHRTCLWKTSKGASRRALPGASPDRGLQPAI